MKEMPEAIQQAFRGLEQQVQTHLEGLKSQSEQRISGLEKELAREFEEKAQLNEECQALKTRVQELDARARKADTLVGRAEAQQTALRALESERDNLLQRIAELESESSEYRRKLEDLRDQLHKEAQQSSELTMQVVDLKLQIEAEKKRQRGIVDEPPKFNLPEAAEPPVEDEQKQLLRLAYEDSTTGLPNHRLGRKFLQMQMSRLSKEGGTLSLTMVDVESVDELNGLLGKPQVDEILRQFGGRLRNLIGSRDELVRGEDDEFWLIQPIANRGPLGLKTAGENVTRLVQSLLEGLKTPFATEDAKVNLAIRCGSATSQGLPPKSASTEAEEVEDLIHRARIATQAARVSTRSRLALYQPEMEKNQRKRAQLVPLLRQALNREQYTLRFQPVVELKSRVIKGVEGLLRWDHPAEGVVEPREFLEAAQESGLIVPLGEWVAHQMCNLSRHYRHLAWFINVSAVELLQADFVRRFTKALESAQLSRPDFIVAEIRETHLLGESPQLLQSLRELRKWNVRLSVDDLSFQSLSLRQLQRLEFSYFKIDPELVQNLDQPFNRNLIRGALLAAEALGGKVIAEGIETVGQFEQLQELGCHWGQGYFLSPPLQWGEMEGKLEIR